jgi:PIN domain nuclease of toxin-antitoxin system
MLPPHRGDPFDRLLVAQAMAESLPIVTNDKKIKLFDVKVIW